MMFLFKKIKASTLQLVLVVAVIIVILLFAFISLMYYQQKAAIKQSNYTENIYKNHQVYAYLKNVDIPYGHTDTLDFFTNVSVKKKQWGCFELLSVKTNTNKASFEQIALMGAANTTKNALYLKNNNQQLILVGNTKITGNTALPNVGVNSGYINGISYAKNKLIYGEIMHSESKLPFLKNKEKIHTFLARYAQDSIGTFDLEDGSIHRQSFTKNTLVHKNNGPIDIVHTNLIGNIIIASDTLIRVHANSKLQDVILIAPKIEILPNFNGNIQAFATEKILIHEKSQLAYPSALILLDHSKKSIGTIDISKETTFKGVLSYLSNSDSANYAAQIRTATDTEIFGEVYCEGNFELRGQVYGAVYTHNFMVNHKGTIYINHLFNALINSEKLSKNYAGLEFNTPIKSVAKWLN